MAMSARREYIKALKMYHADNGRYPIVPVNNETVCLGTTSQYPAKNGFAAGQTSRYSSYLSVSVSPDTSVTGNLSKYLSTSPSSDWPSATETHSSAQADYYRGLFYYPGTTAHNGRTAYIWYFLPGQSTCGSDGYGGYDPDTGETQCTV